MQNISHMNALLSVQNIVSRCSSMFWSGWYVGLCVCLSLSLCVLLCFCLCGCFIIIDSARMLLSGVYATVGRPSVCLSRPTAAHHCCGFAAVGRAGWKYRLITAAVACECGCTYIDTDIVTLTLRLSVTLSAYKLCVCDWQVSKLQLRGGAWWVVVSESQWQWRGPHTAVDWQRDTACTQPDHPTSTPQQTSGYIPTLYMLNSNIDQSLNAWNHYWVHQLPAYPHNLLQRFVLTSQLATGNF